jgi:hypothetical protein
MPAASTMTVGNGNYVLSNSFTRQRRQLSRCMQFGRAKYMGRTPPASQCGTLGSWSKLPAGNSSIDARPPDDG